MKVFELAAELGVGVQEIKDLLDKTQASASLSDEEVAAARAALGKDKTVETPKQEPKPEPKPKAAAPSEDNTIEFWSNIKDHAFLCFHNKQSVMVQFEDYRLCALRGGEVANALLELHDPDIYVISDKPFESIKDVDRFRQMLEQKIYTGPHREPSLDRGLGFLLALFRKTEQPEASGVLTKHGISALIEWAVRKKSYRSTTEGAGKI
jgi:hypothetical protein